MTPQTSTETLPEISTMRECDWFRDGSLYVAVLSGMPEQHVEVGTGDSRREAFESLAATPIQSTGRDSGVRAALCWARGKGWITAAVDESGEDRTASECA